MWRTRATCASAGTVKPPTPTRLVPLGTKPTTAVTLTTTALPGVTQLTQTNAGATVTFRSAETQLTQTNAGVTVTFRSAETLKFTSG